MVLIGSQGGARSSLALGWLVHGPLALVNQPYPVMLVIGTFSEEDERTIGKEKLEFADVRWMEISSVLKRESQNGTKAAD